MSCPDHLPGADLAARLRAAAGPRARAAVLLRSAAGLRLTPVYIAAIVAIGLVLDHVAGPRTRAAVVAANSTNVDNLEHHRIWTLVTSAFVFDGRLDPAAVAVLLPLLAAAELVWGWRRLLAVFFVANAVASCLVYAMLRAGVRHNWLDGAITMASDVGTSYGAHAVGGAIAFSLPVHARRVLVPLALVAVVVPMLDERTFTDVGHLLSAVLGFVAGWRIRRHPLGARLRRPPGTDRPLTYAFGGLAHAQAALTVALHLHEHRRLCLDDAVVAWRDRGTHRVHARRIRDLGPVHGALVGGACGVVLGTLAGPPVAGLVAGAAAGALVALWRGPGLADAAVRGALDAQPAGTAVLLLLADPGARPLLTRALSGIGGVPVPAGGLASPRRG